MRPTAAAVAIVAFALSLPASSAAQGFVVPNIGWDVGGSAGNCPSLLTDCREKRVNYGVAFGAFRGGGIVGLESDIAYAPDFFGESASFGTNSVLTVMGNILIAIPAGPVRPYVAGGLGLIRTRLDLLVTPSSEDVSANHFGYNFGGGLMILLPLHLGIRGDIRYFRSASDISILGIDLSDTKINFTRVSVGVVIH
jgi:opacity protein-like surface antigen